MKASSARTSLKFISVLLAILLPCSVLLYETTLRASNIITVSSTTDPASTSGNGLCTLREAIDNANAESDTSGGDCAAGTGNDIINFSVSGQITLGSTLPSIAHTVMIDGTGQTITVDGASTYRVLEVGQGAMLNLNNMDIADRNSTSNSPPYGGGIWNSGSNSTLTITNSTIASNAAVYGGGIFNTGALTVANSTFTGNSAGNVGGAIYGFGSPGGSSRMTITNTTVSQNACGVYNDGGNATVSSTTFSHNSTGNECDLINTGQNGTLSVTNSTFSGGAGGYELLANSNTGSTNVTNSTFTGSGGSYGIGTNGATSPVTVSNSILTGFGESCQYPIIDGGNNISSDNFCGFATSTGANGQTLGPNVNPQLDPLGLKNNGGPTQTIALQGSSPAIDAIPSGNANCPGTDQRGDPRPAPGYSACDVGAFEYQPLVVNTLSDSSPSGDGLCSLREAINNANNPGVDTTGGDCQIGNSSSTIKFSVSGIITLVGTLPAIHTAATIDGAGQSITIDGANLYLVFSVNSGATLNLIDVTVAHGLGTHGAASTISAR